MPPRLQYQKPELTEAVQNAVYRAIEERNAFQRANTEVRSTNKELVSARAAIQLTTNLYRTWSDSASQLEDQWRTAAEELTMLRRRHCDDTFILPPEATFNIAEALLTWLKVMGTSVIPEFTLDGDGNLYLEWHSDMRRLSICLSSAPSGHYIYLGEGRAYKAYPLTLSNIEMAINTYLA